MLSSAMRTSNSVPKSYDAVKMLSANRLKQLSSHKKC